MKRISIVAATLLALVGVGLLTYLWIVLGDRGLEADAHQTAGYTYPYEYAMGIAAFALLGISIYIFRKKIR